MSLTGRGSAADTPRAIGGQEAGGSGPGTASPWGTGRPEAPPGEADAQTAVLSASSGHNGSLERQESVATTEARLRMEGVELKEEWQDEDFPRPLPEEEDGQLDDELFSKASVNRQSVTQSYGLSGEKKPKRKLLAPDISLVLDRSEGSVLSDELDESAELDLDAMDTPSDNSNEFEWEASRGRTLPCVLWD